MLEKIFWDALLHTIERQAFSCDARKSCADAGSSAGIRGLLAIAIGDELTYNPTGSMYPPLTSPTFRRITWNFAYLGALAQGSAKPPSLCAEEAIRLLDDSSPCPVLGHPNLDGFVWHITFLSTLLFSHPAQAKFSADRARKQSKPPEDESFRPVMLG